MACNILVRKESDLVGIWMLPGGIPVAFHKLTTMAVYDSGSIDVINAVLVWCYTHDFSYNILVLLKLEALDDRTILIVKIDIGYLKPCFCDFLEIPEPRPAREERAWNVAERGLEYS